VKKIIKNLLNIGHLSTAYHTNFILMDDEELKNDLKIGINWILFGTGPAMVKAFSNKEIDLGYMGLPPAIIGIDRSITIKCIAGGHIEGTIMIARRKYRKFDQLSKDLSKTLSQFIGKTIGVPSKGSIHDVILNYYLEKFELKDKIEVKNYDQAEFIALDLKKGILEAGVGTPSLAVFCSTVLDSHIVIPSQYLFENNPSYGIFAHENLITNFPDIVIKFLTHHKRASNFIRDSPLLAAQKIADSFKLVDRDYIKKILEISQKYCVALSDEYIKSTMNFVKILHELGYIKKELKIQDIFNFEFIEKVHPEQHHYTFYV
jgi:NitT/TauT family transport system substrate-binding protein